MQIGKVDYVASAASDGTKPATAFIILEVHQYHEYNIV